MAFQHFPTRYPDIDPCHLCTCGYWEPAEESYAPPNRLGNTAWQAVYLSQFEDLGGHTGPLPEWYVGGLDTNEA